MPAIFSAALFNGKEFIPMNFGPDPQPTPKAPQPTLEQCLALMKTAKRCELHTIRFFKDASCDISAYDKTLMAFDNIGQLHQWLLERQPSKTVTVEIMRADAQHYCEFNFQNPGNVRIRDAFKAALEN